MDKKEVIEKIKKIFGLEPESTVVTAAAGTVSAPQADGSVLVITYADPSATAPSVGDSAMLGDVPAPAGVYMLPDGSSLTVDDTGLVSAVAPVGAPAVTVDAAAAGAPPVAAEMTTEEKVNAFDARLKAIEASLGEMKTKMGAFESESGKKADGFAAAKALSDQFASIEEALKLLVTIPAETPKTLSEGEKAKFDRSAKRQTGLNKVAESIQKLEGVKRY
jgi:hypothetical protein